MKPHLLVLVAAMTTVTADAFSATELRDDMFPGSSCIGIDAASAADISYNTTGRLRNDGTVTRTVICPVGMNHNVDGNDTVSAMVYMAQSTSCTLRLIRPDGSTYGSSSVTAPIAFMSRTGEPDDMWFSANVRCAIPAGGVLYSYLIQRRTLDGGR